MSVQRMCLDKKRFGSKAEALVFASRALARPGCDVGAFRAYSCPACKGWHLTSRVAKEPDLSFSTIDRAIEGTK